MILFLILSLFFNAEARDSIKLDLSNGIVFPSKNSSTRENPAAMALTDGDTIETLVGIPDSESNKTRASLSYQGSSDKAGFGMTYYQTAANKFIYGGFGINADWIQMGMSGFFETTYWDAGADLGVRFGKLDGPAAAIVVRDFVGGFYHFVFGAAYNFSTPGVIAEIDFDYQRSSNELVAIAKATLYRDFFSLHAGYTYPISPRSGLAFRNLELGASFWMNNKMALLFVYHHELACYLLGLKISLD